MPDTAQRRELRYQSLREPVYIVGLDWQFEWLPPEIRQVIRLYNADRKLPEIARKMNRTAWDTLMLINDLAGRGVIERREGWVWVKEV